MLFEFLFCFVKMDGWRVGSMLVGSSALSYPNKHTHALLLETEREGKRDTGLCWFVDAFCFHSKIARQHQSGVMAALVLNAVANKAAAAAEEEEELLQLQLDAVSVLILRGGFDVAKRRYEMR